MKQTQRQSGKQAALTRYFGGPGHGTDEEDSSDDGPGADSSPYEESDGEVAYWSRVKSRAQGGKKKSAVYSVTDDLKANNAALKKIKGNGANQAAFVFEPQSISKVGPTWSTKDFELNQAQLLHFG